MTSAWNGEGGGDNQSIKLANWWGTGSKAPNNFVDVVYGGPLVIPALTHLIAAASHSLKSQD